MPRLGLVAATRHPSRPGRECPEAQGRLGSLRRDSGLDVDFPLVGHFGNRVLEIELREIDG